MAIVARIAIIAITIINSINVKPLCKGLEKVSFIKLNFLLVE